MKSTASVNKDNELVFLVNCDSDSAVCTKDSVTENVVYEEKVIGEDTIEESIIIDNANETLGNATLGEPVIKIINVSNMTSQENVPIEFIDDELSNAIMNADITYAVDTLDLIGEATSDYCTQKYNNLQEPETHSVDLSSNEQLKENCSTLANVHPPCTENPKENCSAFDKVEPPVIQKPKENCSILANLNPAPVNEETGDNCNTIASKEVQIKCESFKNSFTLPTDYLPKKKRSKVETSGKAKLPAAGTSDAWFEMQLVKEKKQKLKEEKLAQKKKLQEEKKKLAHEKKILQEKMNEIQRKIKQEIN